MTPTGRHDEPADRSRVAVLGIDGLPARHGGFETCVEEVSARLAAAGHPVTVYCRARQVWWSQKGSLAGVNLVNTPAIPTKHLLTLSGTATAALHAIARGEDVIHLYGIGNAPVIPLLKAAGCRVIVSIDGLDSRRAKWGPKARRYLRWCERLASALSDVVVVDSEVVAEYYRRNYDCRTEYVPYGGDYPEPRVSELLPAHGLTRERYILFVGRLVPEKNVHLLLEAYAKAASELPLVIVGGSRFDDWYSRHLRSTAVGDVRFLGYVYGEQYRELVRYSYLYVQPSAVEGTSPSLLCAMGYGRCVIVNSIEENLETVGDAGASFRLNDSHSLAEQISRLVADPSLTAEYGTRARARVASRYTWAGVAERLATLYWSAAEPRRAIV